MKAEIREWWSELAEQLDMSEYEIKVVAYLASKGYEVGDLQEGVDFHRVKASQLFDIDIETVTDEQRQKAKSISLINRY